VTGADEVLVVAVVAVDAAWELELELEAVVVVVVEVETTAAAADPALHPGEAHWQVAASEQEGEPPPPQGTWR